MTMPHRGGRRFGPHAGGLGPRRGLRGRQLADLQQQRLHFWLDRLTEQEGRVRSWLEFLQQDAAPEERVERTRTAGEGGDRPSPYSGRTPPHGGSAGAEQRGRRRSAEGDSDSDGTPEEGKGSTTGPGRPERSSPRPPTGRRRAR
jgi:hypothetical protein